MTFFAAFRAGQFLRKESRSRIFQKILRRSQESARRPWCGPTVGLFIYSLNWDRNVSCRLCDALGGDTRNECFWLKSHYISLFSPKNHCLAQFGQDLSGDPDGDDS